MKEGFLDILTAHSATEYVVVFLASYLIGSVPFGLILTQMAGLGDVRKIGSGNIGATNVLRTGNKGLAAATLLLDGLKGTAAIAFTVFYAGPEDIPIPGGKVSVLSATLALAGVSALLGHLFPLWLKFRGGKGVATYFGILLGLLPVLQTAFLVSIALWLFTFFLTRISSLSALVAVASAPLLFGFFGYPKLFSLCVGSLFTLMIFFTHRENIRRLLKGEEKSFRKKKEEHT